jgi:hypothetical protein
MEHAAHAPEGLFRDDVGGDADKVLAVEAATNEHIAHLKTLLASVDTPVGRQTIADYGINKVSDEEDDKLASYFFVVSSLKAFPPVARDLFVDAMVHCEDGMGPLKNATAIREKYEKEIRPAL